jgi:SulP family sulfate permease
MASMAALLLMVAWNMSEARHFVRIIKIAPRDDVIVMAICFSLTVLFDMTIAVGVGMGLAAILFIRRSISLTTTKKVEVNHDLYGDLANKVVIYDIDGPLFFGSAQKAIKSISDVLSEVRVVILDMSEVNMIDMSAIIAMESIARLLDKNNMVLIINNLQPRMILKLRRAGIRLKPGKIYYSRTLDEGIKKAKTFV